MAHGKKSKLKTKKTPVVPSSSENAVLAEKFERLSPDTQRQLLMATELKQEIHVGPIPSPQDLTSYDKTLPGLAERIVSMAEKEQEMRNQAGQAKAENIKLIIGNKKRAISYSGLIGVAIIIVAGIGTWNGSALIALPLGLAGTLTTLFSFVWDKLKPRDNN